MKFAQWLSSERHRRLLERWSVVLTLLWECLKTFVVGETFSKYGVNPYIYFVIVVTIAIPYAKLIVRLIAATVFEHWRTVFLVTPPLLILHFIPDIYIIFAADALPTTLLDGFILIVIIFLFIGIRTFVMKVSSEKRRARSLQRDEKSK